jgi:hypothetical protein
MVPLLTSMFEQTTGLNLHDMIAGKATANGHGDLVITDPDEPASSLASARQSEPDPTPSTSPVPASQEIANGVVPLSGGESGSK